ncbi:hypothetical protein EXIGLDRAFT_52699 [Exidia glandulosa HHB12029]|uniref:Uncharacterized protein n=1 Tax=Exidia glandulosa HHB12029 TaxID=1314781 RepID=A0A165ICZ4_EXIGL|nr:hypothetical protein EXIGLDRAFT_52699 [Exidia glandulosa HHB12029]
MNRPGAAANRHSVLPSSGTALTLMEVHYRSNMIERRRSRSRAFPCMFVLHE